MSDDVLGLVGSLLALAGALFFLTAAIGLIRLPDFYTRAHAPTKAATLGVILVALASIARQDVSDAAFWLEKLLLVVFVMITVPVGTQMLVRGAAARGLPQTDRAQGMPAARPIERVD